MQVGSRVYITNKFKDRYRIGTNGPFYIVGPMSKGWKLNNGFWVIEEDLYYNFNDYYEEVSSR